MTTRMNISIPLEELGYSGMAAEIQLCLYSCIQDDFKHLSCSADKYYFRTQLHQKIRLLRALRARIAAKVKAKQGHEMLFLPIAPIKSNTFKRFSNGESRVQFHH